MNASGVTKTSQLALLMHCICVHGLELASRCCRMERVVVAIAVHDLLGEVLRWSGTGALHTESDEAVKNSRAESPRDHAG